MALPEDVPDGAALRAFRKSLGWSQRELAARLDVTEKTVRWWETGRGAIPLSRWKGLQWARQQELARRAGGVPPGGAQALASGIPLRLAGKVCTGERIAVGDVDMGSVDVRPGLVPSGLACVVEVGDKSMAPTLWMGDLVVVGLEMLPIVGDMVCATDETQGTLIRRLVSQAGGPLLVAEAAGFPPCDAAGPHIVVHGVVTGIASRVFRV